MRSKYTDTASNGVHYFLVDWNPKELNWADFRGKLFIYINLTRPISAAPRLAVSLERGMIRHVAVAVAVLPTATPFCSAGLAQLAHARQL